MKEKVYVFVCIIVSTYHHFNLLHLTDCLHTYFYIFFPTKIQKQL